MTEQHAHNWKLPDGPFVVIDTAPPQYPYSCECGAFTHDPERGEPCDTCAPDDYAKRGPTITLRGGPFDGKEIARPSNRSVWLQMDRPDKRMLQCASYEATDDPVQWKFRSYIWAQPFEPRMQEEQAASH